MTLATVSAQTTGVGYKAATIYAIFEVRFLTRSMTDRGIRNVIRRRLPLLVLRPITWTPGSFSNILRTVAVEYCHIDAIWAAVKVVCFPSSTNGSSFEGLRLRAGFSAAGLPGV